MTTCYFVIDYFIRCCEGVMLSAEERSLFTFLIEVNQAVLSGSL
jgi:hypothetical protein